MGHLLRRAPLPVHLHCRHALLVPELPSPAHPLRLRSDSEGGVLRGRRAHLVVLLFHLALRGDLRLGSVRLHLHQLLLQQLVHGWSRPPRADAIDEAAASEVGEDGSGLEVLKAASPTTLGGRDARSLVSIVSSATAK